MPEPPAGYAGEAVVGALLETLERQCSAYCLLGACGDLPAQVHSDIDFMVGREDFERLAMILQALAEETGFRLVQEFRHETTARYFALAKSRPGQVMYLHPDAATDYRRNGRTWLRAEDVLARRRRHANGFWTAGPVENFLYSLIKSIDKGRLGEAQARELGRLFVEDPQGCAQALERRFTAEASRQIAAACRSGEWQPVFAAVAALDKELLARAPTDPPGTRMAEFARRARRWLWPSGLWVAVLGPDGSGKSSLIERYRPALAPAFRKTACFHLRPRLFRGIEAAEAAKTDPHGQPPRGVAASIVKLLFLWADYALGYWVRIRPLLVRSTLVIFDRYYSDLLADPLRFRYQGPRWMARVVGALIPKPDLTFVLDAPPEVLQARKQEVTAEESARQANAYRELAGSASARKRTVVIDAERAREEVIHDCAEQTLAWMARRTARRLRIEAEER